MEDRAANPSNSGSNGAASGLDKTVLTGMSVEECQKVMKKSFKLPMVRFLREELEKAGCPVKEKFFKAMFCDRKAVGSYIRGEGIVVCANHVNFEDEIKQVIIHELIHAYDDCRAANMNWLNCAHHACSEIRAGHLSGDCHFKRELLRGHFKLRGHEQDCIRRRVMMSLANNPYCTEAAAKNAMEAVWDICYNDTKPFDRAP